MANVTRRMAIAWILAGALASTQAFAQEEMSIRLALQEGGTAAWEIAAMQAAGLDKAHQISIDIRSVADSRATQIALQAGEVEVMLSDFVWVSQQRHQGADFTFVPHSLAVGGLMADPKGPVKSVGDLAGATLGVAGGAGGQSYIVLQAYFAAQTGQSLPGLISAEFGPPPLVNEMLIGGQAQAALNFWHFNARRNWPEWCRSSA